MQPCRAQCGFYLSYVSVLIPSVDAGLMHFLEKQEKHRLVVLFSSYFSMKGSHTDPRFLHWKWTGIPFSQLEKPEEKQDQSLLQFVPDGIQSPVLGCDLGWWLLGTKWFTPLQGPKGMTAGKKENTVADVILWGEQVAWGFPACPCWLPSMACGSLPHQCMSFSLPISLLCSLYMIYVSGWWIERLPWLCWSQGQLHLPSSASKPDCGWNTSRCYNFKFSFRLINALMVIAVDL